MKRRIVMSAKALEQLKAMNLSEEEMKELAAQLDDLAEHPEKGEPVPEEEVAKLGLDKDGVRKDDVELRRDVPEN